jgi:CDP-6-deoxy-D-xylo-4-hexulose-3-dehydrase
MNTTKTIRNTIRWLTGKYYEQAFRPVKFIPGVTPIPASAKSLDAHDLQNLIDASLDGWLTTGPWAKKFERELAEFCGVRYASLCNSGSSANLLALSALKLEPGDEVITTAAAFPTTVNPIVQCGLVPVFVDITIPSYNVDVTQLEAAVSPRTKAVILAHTLGNPFDVDAVQDFCDKHNLYLISDCCDAIGSLYKGSLVTSLGDMATVSFYPAHQITTGEGGAVLSSVYPLVRKVESFRDWGRSCWCDPGKDNTCGLRFGLKMGGLPMGYDHKYTYSHIGYNLKATDMQAAIGCSQLEKLPGFIKARRDNFDYLYLGLCDLEEYFILPELSTLTDPSWFGFPLSVREDAPFTRSEIIKHLEDHKIGTRMLFAGNITKQPAYKNVKYRMIGDLHNTDSVMNNVFWIGVHPGIDKQRLDYMIEVLHERIL